MRALALTAALLLGACASTAGPEIVERKGVELTLYYDVPEPVLDLVAEVGALAGEPSLVVASAARSPRKQVEVMIEYYLECDPKPGYPDCGVDYFLQTYEPECLGRMLEVYEPVAGLPPARREAVLQAMTAEVAGAIAAMDADPGVERRCMAHVSAEGVFAVDLDPELTESPFAVYHAVRAMGARVRQSRFFYPDIEHVPSSPAPDAAFHIEVVTASPAAPIAPPLPISP